VHVAVIIPAFNIAGFLPTAIQSVLEQTFSDWSLVIVDDGSTDTTAAVGARSKTSASDCSDSRILGYQPLAMRASQRFWLGMWGRGLSWSRPMH
jgi:cellulose synthase/poly-beta-1,6-N-acetylglucosamine synthase-like glycosyltransferase